MTAIHTALMEIKGFYTVIGVTAIYKTDVTKTGYPINSELQKLKNMIKAEKIESEGSDGGDALFDTINPKLLIERFERFRLDETGFYIKNISRRKAPAFVVASEYDKTFDFAEIDDRDHPFFSDIHRILIKYDYKFKPIGYE